MILKFLAIIGKQQTVNQLVEIQGIRKEIWRETKSNAHAKIYFNGNKQ